MHAATRCCDIIAHYLHVFFGLFGFFWVGGLQVRGFGSFINYVSDEDVVMTDHLNYRHLLVANNSMIPAASRGSDAEGEVEMGSGGSSGGRLRFYAANLEHTMAEANAEFDHARHVDIYGLKKEGSTPILWIKDSSDINLYGAAGGYTAMEDARLVEFSVFLFWLRTTGTFLYKKPPPKLCRRVFFFCLYRVLCNCDGAPITRAFLLPLPLPALCILNATFFGQQRFPSSHSLHH